MAETTTTKKAAPRAKGGGEKTCTVAGCKRAYRAKGLCFFHYKQFRRGELESRPARCQDHFEAWKKSRKKNQAAAPA